MLLPQGTGKSLSWTVGMLYPQVCLYIIIRTGNFYILYIMIVITLTLPIWKSSFNFSSEGERFRQEK